MLNILVIILQMSLQKSIEEETWFDEFETQKPIKHVEGGKKGE